ncbi:MAG: hypothetical protein P8Y69_12690, partial [Gammaproteobacteria bacterium]
EDLIGPSGGGSAAAQRETVGAISRHLGIKVKGPSLARVAHGAYNPLSRTFNRGQIGAWKQVLTKEHRLLIEKRYARLQWLWGYCQGRYLDTVEHPLVAEESQSIP